MTPDQFRRALKLLFLTTHDLARMTGFHPETIMGWITNGPPDPIAMYLFGELKRKGIGNV